jgi:hypothetical protein
MSVAGTPEWSLRLERAESSRLVWAFVISLAVHLTIAGGYYGGKQAVTWVEAHHPNWLAPLKLLPQLVKSPQPPRPPQPMPEPPLMFIDVNPAVATADPPQKPQFESSRNSQAANPESVKDSNVPKITGTQEHVVKTEDVPRQPEKVKQLQPMPPSLPGPEDQAEQKSKPTAPAGDLAMGKPDPNPKKDTGDAPRPRPRTIKEAMARMPETAIPGAKMKQDGGVKRKLDWAAFDVKASLFGAYEETIVAAISQRWFDLLDERAYASDQRGKVIIRFNLHYDGTITGVKISENTTGAEVLGYVCVKAIEDPAPYAPWPSDMRHEIASGVFEVQFTFYYN